MHKSHLETPKKPFVNIKKPSGKIVFLRNFALKNVIFCVFDQPLTSNLCHLYRLARKTTASPTTATRKYATAFRRGVGRSYDEY